MVVAAQPGASPSHPAWPTSEPCRHGSRCQSPGTVTDLLPHYLLITSTSFGPCPNHVEKGLPCQTLGTWCSGRSLPVLSLHHLHLVWPTHELHEEGSPLLDFRHLVQWQISSCLTSSSPQHSLTLPAKHKAPHLSSLFQWAAPSKCGILPPSRPLWTYFQTPGNAMLTSTNFPVRLCLVNQGLSNKHCHLCYVRQT